ncbi:hypothetical protein K523DRAFT_40997 [Schizophyllum commune Tattone D]|nr:hypothetical protein K523DRAFT_40997 [Schizophyllum commune Tattone D]
MLRMPSSGVLLRRSVMARGRAQLDEQDRISDAYLKTSRRTLLALDREVDILETRIRQLEAAMELMKMRKEAAESLRKSLRARKANQARSRDEHDVPTESEDHVGYALPSEERAPRVAGAPISRCFRGTVSTCYANGSVLIVRDGEGTGADLLPL